MSQLLNDERIKGYVAEIMAEQSSKHLPSPDGGGGHERATSSATSAEG
jgi:hypothetical protein